MKRRWMHLALGSALGLAGLGGNVGAQTTDSEVVTFHKRNMSGPRLGVTYVMGQGELWDDLERQGMGRTISQFGWHFEYQIVPKGGGPQFVIEAVPMIGGVEYGKVIPGATLAMGIRFPSGFEFGLGPNATAVNPTGAEVKVRTSLAIAVGKSFSYGGVSLPLNLVLVTSQRGQRVGIIVGYAIQRVG